MASHPPLEIYLSDEAATNRLAECLAPLLVAGDAVLLEGPIGAGKTHFCRSLIRTRLGRAEDVPSPTFTLIQTYDADVEIVHADLYRLTHPDEARELGLQDAFQSAISLVEWPDRLGGDTPENPLRVKFTPGGEGRNATINPGARPAVQKALQAFARSEAATALLQSAGWQAARHENLGGDASARRYERLYLGTETRLLMDSPPGQTDSVDDFSKIGRHLLAIGLSAPQIHAEDSANGFLLIEDFGDGVFARLIQASPASEGPLYTAAVDTLLHLQSHDPAPAIPFLTTEAWAQSVGLAPDWYRFAAIGDRVDSAPLVSCLQDHLHRLANAPPVMILRDYHAENLMWLPEREGLKRVGLLDFQLAQMGQPGYDLVSLLQDARRDVSLEVEAQMVRHFVRGKGVREVDFMPGYACLGALRALRILGIFARLCLVDGKPGYISYLPRVWGHLQRNLAHPAMQGLAEVCHALLPPPTDETLLRIRAQCGNFH